MLTIFSRIILWLEVEEVASNNFFLTSNVEQGELILCDIFGFG